MLSIVEAPVCTVVTTQEPKLADNAVKVLANRYLKKDSTGKCTETPRDLFMRVATAVAAAEGEKKDTYRDIYYGLMASGEFMPNSPTLMNAGREMGMLSACFVLPIGDSIDEIFDTVKATALIQKAGGGTGFSFDRLRPTGDYIKSSGGTTSGPISFWRVLSEATNAIQQGAFRRGANMGMMRIDNPDILKFIFAKQDLTHFQNYNISVKIPDSWMEDYKRDPDGPNIVTNYRTGDQYILPKSLDVHKYQLNELVSTATKGEYWSRRDIWDTIIQNAWATGEPGVCFIDKVNKTNPTPNVGEMEATNPCGEQPLLPYEACNLGSINLAAFTSPDGVDWESLRECVHLSTRFLEDVVEVNNYVLPEIDKVCRSNRKIGLGIMGFADSLFQMGIGYNTEEGVSWGERFMKFINDEAHNMSEQLAEERGVFPNWKGSRWDTEWKRKQRNACSTTVAPTGTISIIAGCSGGIEPLFSLTFYRQIMRDHLGKAQEMVEVNQFFRAKAEANNWWGYKEGELLDRVAKEGTIQHIDNIPDDVKRVFVCAHDISPEWHVRMQAGFQKFCDSSISKTTNFPHDATPEQVRNIYEMAYDLDCKGVTVYRDGCRKGQPMALKEKVAPVESPNAQPLALRKTPTVLSAVRIRQATPFGHMHVNITVDMKQDQELEVFAQLGKAGDIAASDLEAMCRMVSLYLRSGGTLEPVIKQLEGIGSSLSIPSKDGSILSLGDALGKTLKKYVNAKKKYGLKAILLGEVDVAEEPIKDATAPNKYNKADETLSSFKLKCPSCKSGILAFTEGCQKCVSCGYSKC